jgi:DNA mismatch endonuclease, patch repair protein
MAGIKSEHTKLELLLRRGLHARGFRFRLHARELPGSPDIVLPKHRAVIFAHGCFWHGHDCHLFKWPKSREAFWRTKIERNRELDERAIKRLEEARWRSAVVWECACRGRHRHGIDDVLEQLSAWLRTDDPRLEIRGRFCNT